MPPVQRDANKGHEAFREMMNRHKNAGPSQAPGRLSAVGLLTQLEAGHKLLCNAASWMRTCIVVDGVDAFDHYRGPGDVGRHDEHCQRSSEAT